MSRAPVTLQSREGQRFLEECTSRAAYDALWPHFYTQRGATTCGPCSLSMVLNALKLPLDAAVLWDEDEVLARAPDMADKVRTRGCTLDEAAGLARAVGVEFVLERASTNTAADLMLDALRRAPESLVLLNYHMSTAGQEPFGGHFSPLAAYHEGSDRFLVLDCWPATEPSWLDAGRLCAAVARPDPEAGLPRGLMRLSR